MTQEPSNGVVGQLLRQALRGREVEVGQDAMALLFAADRLDHLQREILPALQRGQDAVVDRYLLSSLAYQGWAVGDQRWVEGINSRARWPDTTLILDVPVPVALERIEGRSEERSVFEHEPMLQDIRQLYLDLAARHGQVRVIDGTLAVEDVFGLIKAEIRL